ncbi:MAG TPA: hypothetical protein PKE27_00805 [Povalibacter sp.]|uniref:hypothetical protein n=1 Tax=Povalibacter sp. TaxID=1962978 RepID=UPI002BAE15C5|nr:hypothetical protein [Povalibacter sp.]HMN43088.1 hypothetical protein [Povalibacter sp.]
MTRSSSAENPSNAHRLRFELIAASLLLAFGLFVLPAPVYWVGSTLLGPYGKDAGMGTFYGDFFGDLAIGGIRAWALALGPLIIVEIVRLLFLRRAGPDSSDAHAAPPQTSPRRDAEGRRVEPRVSLD